MKCMLNGSAFIFTVQCSLCSIRSSSIVWQLHGCVVSILFFCSSWKQTRQYNIVWKLNWPTGRFLCMHEIPTNFSNVSHSLNHFCFRCTLECVFSTFEVSKFYSSLNSSLLNRSIFGLLGCRSSVFCASFLVCAKFFRIFHHCQTKVVFISMKIS